MARVVQNFVYMFLFLISIQTGVALGCPPCESTIKYPKGGEFLLQNSSIVCVVVTPGGCDDIASLELYNLEKSKLYSFKKTQRSSDETSTLDVRLNVDTGTYSVKILTVSGSQIVTQSFIRIATKINDSYAQQRTDTCGLKARQVPGKHEIVLESTTEDDLVRATLSTVDGRLLKSFLLHPGELQTAEVPGLAAGLYLITVTTTGCQSVIKLLQ